MKLLSVTDKEGIQLLIDAMKVNPRYNTDRSLDEIKIEFPKYQIAIIPIVDGVVVGSFYQTTWERVGIDEISGDYYVMPLLSGWRMQVHIKDESSKGQIDMFSSNGRCLNSNDKLQAVAKALWDTGLRNSVIEAVWREEENICYITDIVMMDGVDISNSVYADRYSVMESMGISMPIKLIPIKVIRGRFELDEFMEDKSSVVIRDGNSPTKVSIYTKQDDKSNDEEAARNELISALRKSNKIPGAFGDAIDEINELADKIANIEV